MPHRFTWVVMFIAQGYSHQCFDLMEGQYQRKKEDQSNCSTEPDSLFVLTVVG